LTKTDIDPLQMLSRKRVGSQADPLSDLNKAAGKYLLAAFVFSLPRVKILTTGKNYRVQNADRRLQKAIMFTGS